jgi:hypothetical protein
MEEGDRRHPTPARHRRTHTYDVHMHADPMNERACECVRRVLSACAHACAYGRGTTLWTWHAYIRGQRMRRLCQSPKVGIGGALLRIHDYVRLDRLPSKNMKQQSLRHLGRSCAHTCSMYIHPTALGCMHVHTPHADRPTDVHTQYARACMTA